MGNSFFSFSPLFNKSFQLKRSTSHPCCWLLSLIQHARSSFKHRQAIILYHEAEGWLFTVFRCCRKTTFKVNCGAIRNKNNAEIFISQSNLTLFLNLPHSSFPYESHSLLVSWQAFHVCRYINMPFNQDHDLYLFHFAPYYYIRWVRQDDCV